MKMEEAKFSYSDLPQATRALQFIQVQLDELAKNCLETWENNLVSPKYYLELENKLEKILHETRAVCRPPPRKPVKSDFGIIKRVASGGFGTVYIVRHKKTRNVFAMKKLKQEKQYREEVLLERDILSFLDSPLVVSMFCSFETKKHLYMVMEYIGGGTMDSLLEYHDRLSVAASRFYISELVSALEYIHRQGIIHRDLKPDNLLLTTSGHIKVADFGLSKLAAVNTAGWTAQQIAREFTDREMCGTPCYMSPEVILREGYGRPVDWWATGIMLYVFLNGCSPFDYAEDKEDDVSQHLTRVVRDGICWSNGIKMSASTRNLIIALLNKNCVTRLGTRGAYEVRRHPFFSSVDWNNLVNQKSPCSPEVENGEDAASFGRSLPLWPDVPSDAGGDQEKSPAEEPAFSYVAFRFKEVYGSPLPLSDGGLQEVDSSEYYTCCEPTSSSHYSSASAGMKSGEDSIGPAVDDVAAEDSADPAIGDVAAEDSADPAVGDVAAEDSADPAVGDVAAEDSADPAVKDDSDEDNGYSSVDDISTVHDEATSKPKPLFWHPNPLMNTMNPLLMMYHDISTVHDEATSKPKPLFWHPNPLMNTMNPLLMMYQMRRKGINPLVRKRTNPLLWLARKMGMWMSSEET